MSGVCPRETQHVELHTYLKGNSSQPHNFEARDPSLTISRCQDFVVCGEEHIIFFLLVIVYPWTLISDFRTPENPGFAVGYAPLFTREKKKSEYHTKPLCVGSLVGCLVDLLCWCHVVVVVFIDFVAALPMPQMPPLTPKALQPSLLHCPRSHYRHHQCRCPHLSHCRPCRLCCHALL